MDPDELRNFFSNLAEKFQKENDLSDITWALCESCPAFKLKFLSFFFEEIIDVGGITLQREFSFDNSRPDFFFEHNGKSYIIEIKKADRNTHFEQYRSTFNESRFGWIANYEERKRSDIVVKTWKELKDFLELSIQFKANDANLDLVIGGYCEYIQKVCSILKFHKMKLDNLSSLFEFYNLIGKIIENPVDGVVCSIYSQAKGIREDRSGRIFTIRKSENPERVIYPWFGIYYSQELTCICIGFSQAWCGPVYEAVKQVRRKGVYYIEPYEEDKTFWFELESSLFEDFNREETTIEKQKELLMAFFNEVIENVKPYL